MKVLGYRFCVVHDKAEDLAGLLGNGLGLKEKNMSSDPKEFAGSIFPVDESWVEVWPTSEGMPACTMLQIVVDDADAFVQDAKNRGVELDGPFDAHGERIYYLNSPTGMPISIQSKSEK